MSHHTPLNNISQIFIVWATQSTEPSREHMYTKVPCGHLKPRCAAGRKEAQYSGSRWAKQPHLTVCCEEAVVGLSGVHPFLLREACGRHCLLSSRLSKQLCRWRGREGTSHLAGSWEKPLGYFPGSPPAVANERPHLETQR